MTYEEFGQAAKSLGFHILPANLDEECRKIDTDLSGIIDEEEFVRFVQSRHAARAPAPLCSTGLNAFCSYVDLCSSALELFQCRQIEDCGNSRY